MNKKKSKALAFLLTASLLVPSANGVVSAAELRGGGVAIVDYDNLKVKEETFANSDTINTNDVIMEGIKYTTLKEALEVANKKEGIQTIELLNDIKIENSTSLGNVKIKSHDINKKAKINLISSLRVNNKVNLENIELVANTEGMVMIHNDSNVNLTIEKCLIKTIPSVKTVKNVVTDGGATSTLNLLNNEVYLNARNSFPSVGNSSVIKNNIIDLIDEHYGNSNSRSSTISIVGTQNGKVEISENIFLNANRGIAVDNSPMQGENIKIKNNIFKNVRFAFELDSRTELKGEPNEKQLNNKGKSYDLSNNYYFNDKFGGAGPLRIEDANASGSHFEDGTSTELKIKDETPFNIAVGPYYTKYENGKLSESAHAGVATVNGKDYARLEKAIRAAKPGDTVKLVSDITVDTWNQIWNIKDITIDGFKNETENYKITVNSIVESKENHDAVLHSAGGNTFTNLTIDLIDVEKGNAQGIRAIDAGANDTIDNVTIKGGKDVSYGIVAGKGCGKLTVTNSNISDCEHGVYLEGAQNENVEIKNNTFDGCGYASILQPKNSIFEGNTVKGGKVNIMHEESVVKGNTFERKDNTQSRVKFYDDGITFEYNKIMDDNGTPGATLVFANDIDDKDSISRKIDPRSINLGNNYWGSKNPNLENIIKISENNLEDKDKGILQNIKNDINDKVERSMFKTESALDNALKPSTGGGGGAITPSYTHKEIIGSDRYDTAARIADQLGSYDTVVLVNATSTMSDGLSASGLAGKENGAILLTKKDSIPKATMDRIKKVKKVYIIGGEAAISEKVADEIKAAGIKVERIGGKDRVETSELVAKKLGNYKDAFVVNGFKGEADAMSASAVAAKNKAPILLTNGKESTHDKKSGVKYYVIGGNNVVDKSIADKYSAEVLAGKDRYATNREVIDEFYSGSDKLYLANGDKLVDALTASPLAKKDGIVLVNEKSDKSILKGKNTVQVGGMDFEIKFEK